MLNNQFLTILLGLVFSLSCVVCIKVQTFGHIFQAPTSEHHPRREEKQDLSKIPGIAGVDYPIYHVVPHTNFHCANVPAVPGMYADVEAGCQAYHVCQDASEGHKDASFLCTNGTLFSQKEFSCDWWYNVKCEEATNFYHLNVDPEHNPYIPKKKPSEKENELFFIHAGDHN